MTTIEGRLIALDASESPAEKGFPELCLLGKRIEVLRIQRGISKQLLAKRAGTSRQQLWRVMTGKSELTSSLGLRLARVLDVDIRTLDGSADSTTSGDVARVTLRPQPAPIPSLEAYLADPDRIACTIGTLPSSAAGRRLKRTLLNAIEDLAGEEGVRLPPHFFETRGRVLNGES